MPKFTPAQVSFSAGEISPLMYNRTDTEGYKQGLVSLTNMFADSRGPAFARGGSKFVSKDSGNDARILALPVNDNFFYAGIFYDSKLVIGSMVGHNPSIVHNDNANFNQSSVGWTVATDGNVSSTAVFLAGDVQLNTTDNIGRFVYITQQFTVPSTGNYRLFWNADTVAGMTVKIGTSADDGSVYDSGLTSLESGNIIFNATATTLWMTFRVDGTNQDAGHAGVSYFGITDETPSDIEFVTPYAEEHLEALQGVVAPQGGALYILHESYPPYKLTYDRATDAFSWNIVTFTSEPGEWVAGSYPSTGDFFEGRLWLGGTANEPQTFWASKSGLPEDFTLGTLADDSLQFTMAKFGRIEWMVGFKNLVIGTQNGEHIVTSEGGFIKPDDIQVEQQSSYGSANVQPVQVGDQIFYVSADRRKLRAIQYEWQKDNWLSKDLTFNSEHITEAGIRHIAWQQNPKNLFHCVLNDGTIASLTYERSHDVYGWSKLRMGGEGKILDVVTGPIQGTDYVNIMIQYDSGVICFETQSTESNAHYLDSWADNEIEADSITVNGLGHLEGKTVQVLVNEATHPDRVVSGGAISVQGGVEGDVVIAGLQFIPSLTTLPMNQITNSGGSESHVKRWNKVYVRVLASTMPLINGERAPERFASTLMNEPQPVVSEEILKINLGYGRDQSITVEQDLPRSLVVLGVFGELSQSNL